jgi:hypothetical protein
VAALSKNHGPANFRDLNGTLAGQILYLAWPATCLRWQSSVEKVMKSLNKGAAMKTRRDTSGLCIALPLALSLGAAACRSQGAGASSAAAPAQSQPQAQLQVQSQGQAEIEKQRKDAEQQVRPDIERQRKDAEQQAEKSLDSEAMAAIRDTRTAIAAIADNKINDALTAIERATGKVDVLISRNPATALLPVAFGVEVVDAAPVNLQLVRERVKAADRAFSNKDYPTARVMLDGLTSEIRIRTYNLPLATYPTALKEAARLLDQKKTDEASSVLLVALNTLAIVDRVNPLPLVLASAAVGEAESLREKDKAAAQQLLEVARNEVERAKELGYAGNDPEYLGLSKSIASLETQIKGREDTASFFSSLRGKLSSFFQRQSDAKRG